MTYQARTKHRFAGGLIAAALLLLVAIAGVALVGSGILKLPVTVDASLTPSTAESATPSASADASAAASATPVEQPPASWTATGDMIEATRETATLLLDGTVLVTGGYGPIPDSPLASADLYDPDSETWSATGSMVGFHGGHTVTRLSDGTVLVAGGGSAAGPLTSAELYDPVSGSWSATGEMVEGHGSHLASLLLDGRVLVAGGGLSPSFVNLATAELYDPGSGTWSATGDMVAVRGGATITLLGDGRVLVAGGQFFGVGTAELFDPNTGTWTATGSMAEGRIDHTAVLLPDGRVLVTGGYTLDSTGNNATALPSAELYDPSTGTWTATGSMAQARARQAATLLSDGTVLVAGGQDFRNNTGLGNLATAELYDPISGTWTATAEMIEARLYHTATLLLDGRVLVAGGSTSASAELYNPDSGS